MNVIHIYGASGAGTSTLGRYICEQMGWFFMDTDDYFWEDTDPKFTVKRERAERIRLMERDIAAHEDVVISGSLTGWGDLLMPRFTMAVRLITATEVRLARIERREHERFGGRIDPGGDMYAQHVAFLEWAAAYDAGGRDMRSKAEHDAWEKGLKCPLLKLDGSLSVEENFRKVAGLGEYIADPCGTLSIPYWKNERVDVPGNMRIVHERGFESPMLREYDDEPYFRLKHSLENVEAADGGVAEIVTSRDISLMVEIINRCYEDIRVDITQLEGYKRTPAYAEELWVVAYECGSGAAMGCGIADVDNVAREGVLEWIQVLPEFRGRGVGKAIVNELLRRMHGRADFATVSGKVNSPSAPERLYRSCGFSGSDVWHVMRRK